MYAAFFGLQHAPFSIAPDPRYLFMSDRHREALAHLLYGLDAGGGFVLLTGNIGTGKTTVCRCFLEQVPAQCNVAYIFNPKLTVTELLRSICDEFGVAHAPAAPGAETVKDCIDPLNAFLLQAHAEGRNNVLVIDEAQNLAPEVLEQLRLLTNLETSERKLLQIILIGQPELRDMVASPALEQLAQRVIARFHLHALSPRETQQYIQHRMAVAGLTGPLPFDRRAVQTVHVLARGVPRRINLLCDRALLGAYATGSRIVSEAVVRRAAVEVFGAPRARKAVRRRWSLKPVVAGAAAGLLVAAGAGWALGGWPTWLPKRAAPKPVAAVSDAPRSTVTPVPAPAADVSTGLPAFEPSTTPGAPSALLQFLAAQPASDTPPWQGLAAAWGVRLPDDTHAACTALSAQALQCYQNRRAGLALIREIDRPVLLTLFPVPGEQRSVAMLMRRLHGDFATLEGAGRSLEVPLSELAQVWRGELATLWRGPYGMPDSGDLADLPAGAAWLDRQLDQAVPEQAVTSSAATAAGRRARIQRFQLAQGLTPDGLAGPMTLMLLNRAAGVNEPRLRNGA